MLKGYYSDKTIGIIGYQLNIGRVLLKQMSKLAQFKHIYLIQIGKDTQRRRHILTEPYYSNMNSSLLNKISFLPLQQLSQVNTLDILFNLFMPLELNDIHKIIDYHIIQSNLIAAELKKISIHKIIHLSSIYCNHPGFVTQDQSSTRMVFVPIQSAADAINHIHQNCNNDRQGWQWSILYMEALYEQCSPSFNVIRLPNIGPTLNNHQGYLYKFTFITYLIYQIGNGFMDHLNGKGQSIIDLIPSDYAANYAIVLGSTKTDSYSLHNLSTSSRNPISVKKLIKNVSAAWSQYQNKKIQIKIAQNRWQKKIEDVKTYIPYETKRRLATLMDIKSWKIENNKNQIKFIKQKVLIKKTQFYFDNQWICQSNQSIDLYNQLQKTDQLFFNFNVNQIHWNTYTKLICHSIKKYILHQNVQNFQNSTLNLLQMPNTSYFSDILWAISQGRSIDTMHLNDIKNHVLATKSVQEALKKLVEQHMTKLQTGPKSYKIIQQQYYKIGSEMCDQMFSQYSMKSIRVFAWFLHKVFRRIYQKVVIDKHSMNRLRTHDDKNLGPIILIPTHRSYIDFLIMSYVFFGFGIKCPHIAAAQDFLSMTLVHVLLRKSGAFFIKRNQLKYPHLYKAIMNEYISKLLIESNYLQFFIQGTRSRTGKMLTPKMGILSIIAKNVLQGSIPDAQILPVSINYERVLEGASFTYQMMGQKKVKQSLSRLIKAVDTLNYNFGRIYIEIAEPISVKKFFGNSSLNYQQTLSNLGYQIIYSLTQNLLVTAPAIVSTIALMHRRGISDDSLDEKVSWLCRQIQSRNIKIARSQSNSSISISKTLQIMGEIITKSKKNMFEVQLTFDQNSFIKLFTLTYYRNNLIHIFYQQSLIIIALFRFGHQLIIRQGINQQILFKQVIFLYQLLSEELILKQKINNKLRFNYIINFMCNKLIIRKQQNYIILINTNNQYLQLYCSIIWPLIESYWITSLYLFKLLKQSKNKSNFSIDKLLSQIQWFAQSLISQRIIHFIEAVSLDTLKNAVSFYIRNNYLSTNTIDQNGLKIKCVQLIASEQTLKKASQKIQLFLKSSYARTVKGVFQSSQTSVNLDYPFLSKL